MDGIGYLWVSIKEMDMDRLPNISTSNSTLTGMSMSPLGCSHEEESRRITPYIPEKKKTWLAGNSPCSLGNTSSKWWWQLKHLLFSPRFNGEMIQFDEQIFQMGWKFTFSNRKYSFKRWIFHCHVSIRGVNILEHPKVGPGSRYKSSEITPRSGVK